MKTAAEELEGYLDRKSRLFETALLNYLRAKFMGEGDPAEAFQDLAKLLRNTLTLANLQGRYRTVLEADHLARGKFDKLPDKSPIHYGLTFFEALEDILTREPRVVPAEERHRAMEWVSELYSERHAFAMAKSVTQKLTDRVQAILAKNVDFGMSSGKTENEILKAAAEEAQPFTRAYAQTVFRTNLNGSYTEGRFAQAQDKDVREVIYALEVVGQADNRERHNHKAGRGLLAATDDPIWKKARTPWGYNCRHSVKMVSKYELERRGLLRPDGSVIRYEPPNFSAWHVDEGFRGGEF